MLGRLAIIVLLLGLFSGINLQADLPYRLQCGDILLINIYTQDNVKRNVLVDSSGNINYLFAKNVRARGRTIAEIREDLTQQMATYYKNPLLMITLVNCLGDFYSIMGEVREPGYKKLIGTPTLLTAFCDARGFTTRLFRDQTIDQADLGKTFLIRDGEYVPIDFEKLIIHGDASQDIKLKPNDYIYVFPKNINKIFVMGEVVNPVTVEFLYSMTLAQAIAEAGGITTSASSRVAVIRGSLSLPIKFLIDINRILKGKAMDFPLEPGDIVYVPPMKFVILKEIIRGGIATFVSTVSSIAGVAAYDSINPAAIGTVDTTDTIINTGTSTSVAPVIP